MCELEMIHCCFMKEKTCWHMIFYIALQKLPLSIMQIGVPVKLMVKLINIIEKNCDQNAFLISEWLLNWAG